MNETEQLLVNEMRRMDGAIKKRQKVFDSLASAKGKQIFNRRYVIDLPIDVNVDGFTVSSQPVYRSVIVDRDCIYFCCKEMVYTVSAVGTVSILEDALAGKFSLPNTKAVWFHWEVRDTYADRSWQNLPLPDFAMGSGKTSGLPLARPAVLPAGTELQFTLMPLGGTLPAGVEALSLSVQVSFVGFEVM